MLWYTEYAQCIEHLGWKTITFQSGYKPEKEKTYKIEIHNVQSFQNETIVFSLLFSMENEKHVPDVDDYDDDDDDDDYSRVCG